MGMHILSKYLLIKEKKYCFCTPKILEISDPMPMAIDFQTQAIK